MQLTSTRTEAIERIRDERSRWDELVAQTTTEQMNETLVTEQWTIRDFSAHLLGWWSWRMTRLEAAVTAKPEPSPPWPAHLTDIDERNAWFDRHHRDLSGKEITESYSQLYGLLEDIVSRLSEEELVDRDRFPFLDGESLAESIIGGSFFSHAVQSHAVEIGKWRATVSS